MSRIFTEDVLQRFRDSRNKNIKKRMAILKRSRVVDTTDPNNLKVEKEGDGPIGEILTPLEQLRKENEEKKNKKKDVKKIWDETETSFRFRVRDPKKFKQDSFRTIVFKDSPPKINAVIGKLKGESTTKLQSLIFSKDEGWTLSKAKKWVKDHPDVKKKKIKDKGKKVNTDKMITVKLKEEVQKVEKVAIFIPFAKVDKEKKMVFGIATSEAVDSVGDIVRIKAIEKALPDYMEFGNIREMHQPSAVGVIKEHKLNKKKKFLWIGVKVSDDQAWKKVVDGVYKGFSIGGNIIDAKPLKVKIPVSEITENEVEEKVLLQYAMGKKKCKKDEPFVEVNTGGLEILEIQLIEISLVDRPANPEALIDSFKSANKQKEFIPERVIILKEKKDVDLTNEKGAVNFKVSFLNKSLSEKSIFNFLAQQIIMKEKTLEDVMTAVLKYVKSEGVDLTDDNLSKAKSITLNLPDFKLVVEKLIEKAYSITKGEDDESDDESSESSTEETEESEASDEEVDKEEGQSDDEETDDESDDKEKEGEEEEEEEKDEKEDVEKALSNVVDKALTPLIKQIKSVESEVKKFKKSGKARSTQKGMTAEEANENETEADVFKGILG